MEHGYLKTIKWGAYMADRKIKVLIVDDSFLFRELLDKGISNDASIEVIAKAEDPFDARDKIIEFKPDVMLCDVQMPKMNGIEFIKRLLPQYALPIIVVSTVSEMALDALKAGAVDFVSKPSGKDANNLDMFFNELTKKIKTASKVKITAVKNNNFAVEIIKDSVINSNKIIAMGASTGGTEAIFNILNVIPNNIPGIVIVQHIPPVFSRMFAQRLNDQTKFLVKEAQTGDYMEPGKVILAQGDKHLKIKKVGDRFKIVVFEGEKVNGHCPSVDVLFNSVAKEAGNQAVGVILTGMGYDGATGLLTMRKAGARTIGQDEKSSVVYGMPKVAFEIGAVEKQNSLENIPNEILKALR